VILPDVNLLLYAHVTDYKEHPAALRWWDGAMNGDEDIGLCWVVILGFVRLATHRSVLKRPMTIEAAEQYVLSWLARSVVRIVEPSYKHAAILFGILRELGTAANLTTDAHIAALSVEHRATVCTNDTDFERLPGLRCHNPLVVAGKFT
jgi:toxin-antitoxin system PIN domain toxin